MTRGQPTPTLTKEVLVYGASTFGHVVRALVGDCGHKFAGFIDDRIQGPEIVGNLETLLSRSLAGDFEVAMAIGYRHLDARLALFHRLHSAGYRFATLVHPAAYAAGSARLGEGALLMAHASVDTDAVLGDLVVLWPGAIVSHHSEVGCNTFLAPGAIVCGITRVGTSCFIGAGAVITDGVSVSDGSFVKASSCYSGGPLARARTSA